jgi:SAM-dependent methyltransferase
LSSRRSPRDRELEAGSLAHYEDAAYYTATYRRRIDDVAYYVTLAQNEGGPVLEYGVGNGRIALPMARHGVPVVGIDHSAPMLADLRARLADEPKSVRRLVQTRRGDMRQVQLGRRFALVVAPFNTVLHLYTRPDVEAFLARVREHLAEGGRFVVDLSMPVAADLARPPSRPFQAPRFRHPTAEVVVRNRERFDYDPVRQVLFVAMEFEPENDPAAAWMTPLAHRQFFPQEWEALLHYNGFEVEHVFGDFAQGPLTKDSDSMVWHARLASPRAAPQRAPRKAVAPKRAPRKPVAPQRAPRKPVAPQRAPRKPAAPKRAPRKPAGRRRGAT